MKTTQIRNSLLLLLAAFIWGSAFVAQSTGMDYVGPFTFSFVRNIIGGTVLIPVIYFFGNSKEKVSTKGITKTELIGGICCGLLLFVASNLQQIGIQYTTVGKAGFITALYVVIVPLLGIFMKKRVSILMWLCVLLSVTGLYLLCMTENNFSLAYGDVLVLLCALFFSFHILVIDYFSPKCNGIVISSIQFFVCGVLSGIVMLFAETPDVVSIWDAKWSILYAGVLSSGVAFTLQIVAQKDINPTIASLIMCLESVVAVLAGWAILGEALTARELFGCLFMFIAIVLAQLPMPVKKKERM